MRNHECYSCGALVDDEGRKPKAARVTKGNRGKNMAMFRLTPKEGDSLSIDPKDDGTVVIWWEVEEQEIESDDFD